MVETRASKKQKTIISSVDTVVDGNEPRGGTNARSPAAAATQSKSVVSTHIASQQKPGGYDFGGRGPRGELLDDNSAYESSVMIRKTYDTFLVTTACLNRSVRTLNEIVERPSGGTFATRCDSDAMNYRLYIGQFIQTFIQAKSDMVDLKRGINGMLRNMHDLQSRFPREGYRADMLSKGVPSRPPYAPSSCPVTITLVNNHGRVGVSFKMLIVVDLLFSLIHFHFHVDISAIWPCVLTHPVL